MIFNNPINGLHAKAFKKYSLNPYAFQSFDETVSTFKKFSDGMNPELEAIFMTGGTPEEKGLFKSVDMQGAANLFDFTHNSNDKLDTLVLRTVYGATHKPLPTSALAYAVPSFVVGKKLSKPNIDVIIADGAAIQLNGMPEGKVNYNTSLLFNVMKKYVEAFYPGLVGKVNFWRDKTFTKDLLASPEWAAVFPEMVALLDDNPKIMKEIYGYAEHMGVTKQEADLYSNLHWPEHRVTFDKDAPAKHDNFFTGEKGLLPIGFNLSFGAKPEKDFNAVMNATEKAFGKLSFVGLVPHAQIITDFNNAPYYPKKDGDVSIEAAIKEPRLLKQMDNKALFVGQSQEAVMDFFASLDTKEFKEVVHEYSN